MFKDVAFGQYYPVDSPVHRLDARVKLLLTLMFVIAIFFVKSYFGFMLTLIMLIAIILLARLPMASVLKSVKGVLLIVLITAIINLFVVRGGNDDVVLVHWEIFTITKSGVHTTIKMVLRLVLLISGASLLSLTTTPVALADGVESLMSPLKLIKVPVRDIAMIMSIALRFIPTLFEETNKNHSCAKSARSKFRYGRTFRKSKSVASRSHSAFRQLVQACRRTRVRNGCKMLQRNRKTYENEESKTRLGRPCRVPFDMRVFRGDFA